MDSPTALLRHLVATVRYRADKMILDAGAEFAQARVAESVRTPIEILAHMSDLYDWALRQANGSAQWVPIAPTNWDAEIARFHSALDAFDARLSSAEPIAAPIERLVQGPVADSLTHVGQLAMLRRCAGAPIKHENYFKATISAS